MSTSNKFRWTAALGLPLVAGPVWCLAWSAYGSRIGTLSGFILLSLLITSAITDIRRHRIYNWATYSAFLWALMINIVASAIPSAASAASSAGVGTHTFNWSMMGAVGIGQCLGGAALCFVITFFGYDLSGGGAGDVKLAAAIGALLGIEYGVFAVAYSYIVAGIAIIAWATYSNGPTALLKAASRAIGGLLGPIWPFPATQQDKALLTKPIPLGPYFAVGTLLVILELVPVWHYNF